ncbi:MAG: GtrA family protein [Burkholderiales bacterium]|nr:GtrA family protein [Burkholderiales bacterium]
MRNLLSHRVIIYLIIGGANTLINLLIFYAFLQFGINYLIANVLCFIIGVLLGYILNTLIVFKAQLHFAALLKYSTVYLSSMAINLVLLFLLVHYAELNKMLAQIITTAIVTVVNYVLIKKIVFK